MENRIKSARLAAGLTQDEMSKRFGIPLATIKRWDSGVSIPPEWAARLLLEKLEEEKKSLVRCKEEKGKQPRRSGYFPFFFFCLLSAITSRPPIIYPFRPYSICIYYITLYRHKRMIFAFTRRLSRFAVDVLMFILSAHTSRGTPLLRYSKSSLSSVVKFAICRNRSSSGTVN